MSPVLQIARQRVDVHSLAVLTGSHGKDFSGATIRHVEISGETFFESLFNGGLLENVHATQSIFQHAEFTEAQFANCIFEDTSFDHSDFVLSYARDCEFVRCSFQNAEWRDASFERVNFRQCVFRNTTSSLVHFVDCDFDETSSQSFQGPSKRYCLFVRTRLSIGGPSSDFLKANFGLHSGTKQDATLLDMNDPLHELSVLRYTDSLIVGQFVPLLLTAVKETVAHQEVPQKLKLRYAVAICQLYLDEGSLSVFASQLLNRVLSGYSPGLTDRGQVLDLLGIIVGIRSSIHSRVEGVRAETETLPAGATVRRLDLEFDEVFDRSQVVDYLEQLANFCGVDSTQIVLQTYRRGSTIVDAIILGSVHLSEVFRFVRYSLSAAEITIEAGARFRDTLKTASASSKPIIGSGVEIERRTATQKRPSSPRIPTSDLEGISKNDSTIDVLVDQMNDRVLIVGGKVRVTIALS